MGKRNVVFTTSTENGPPSIDVAGAMTAKENESNSIAYNNRLLKYTLADIGYNNVNSVCNNYVFCEQSINMIDECERWLKSEKWYRGHGLIWSRGCLLLGRQGSGKTSLVRNLCKKFDLPLFVFDLASMSNSEMIDAWTGIQKDAPCAVLFDDIEKVFVKQKNVVRCSKI